MNKVYDTKTEARINEEFSSSKDICYLDHAGATLYSEIQIKNVLNDFLSNVYGNPHSLNHGSKKCTDLIDQVRNRILRHFHATPDEYDLVFTSGATGAIKLLLEAFDWDGTDGDGEVFFDTTSTFPDDRPGSTGAFVYTQTNHTSVVGGREIARYSGIPFFCLGDDEVEGLMQVHHRPTAKSSQPPSSNSLFAYPAQCNFSGKKYPLSWIRKVQEGALDTCGLADGRRHSKWFCLLDAANFCSTSDLNLSQIHPDFVCVSFYKIFGYPTGLGALIVRNSSAHVLKKRYFGGGTVDVALPFQKFHKTRKNLHERFEDGTIPFLSIISLEHGLNTLNRLNLNMNLISSHVFELARYAVKRLTGLRHWNGTPVVELYTDGNYDDPKQQGGIVNFNLKRANREYIGFVEVLHMANLRKIYIRTGCFCNLGACQKYLKLSDADVKKYYQAGHVCGDSKDLIDGRPTGSVRVSFGYMTTQADVDKLVDLVRETFVEVTPQRLPHRQRDEDRGAGMHLTKILLFPIKSCGAMEVESWKLNSKGLEYDREWMVVTSSGLCLTQKQEPKLCLIRPRLNLTQQMLTLSFGSGRDEDAVTIPMNNSQSGHDYDLCESKVCNNFVQAQDCGNEVSEWLSRHLNADGLRLVRQAKDDVRVARKSENDDVQLSFSNQAQYLLINNESVRWLQDTIGPDDEIDTDSFSDRFRGNFYVDGQTEFSESNWKELSIGKIQFKVQGPCGRCQMICIDQKTGEKNRKPLVALSRALSGKLQFGIYLSRISGSGSGVTITVGDPVTVTEL